MLHLHRLLRRTKAVINPGKKKGETNAEFKARMDVDFLKRNVNWDAIEAEQQRVIDKDAACREFLDQAKDLNLDFNPADNTTVTVDPKSLGLTR